MATTGFDCLCGLMVFLSPFFLAVLINGVREEMKKEMSNEEKLAQLKRELRWELATLGGMADLPNYCKRDVRNKIRSLQSHIAKIEIEMGIRPKPEPKPKKSLRELWLEQLEVRRSE